MKKMEIRENGTVQFAPHSNLTMKMEPGKWPRIEPVAFDEIYVQVAPLAYVTLADLVDAYMEVGTRSKDSRWDDG